MGALFRKLRGLMGIGLTWGLLWAAIAAAITIVVGIVDPDSIDAGEGPLRVGAIVGFQGFVAGIVFGLLLSFWGNSQGDPRPFAHSSGSLGRPSLSGTSFREWSAYHHALLRVSSRRYLRVCFRSAGSECRAAPSVAAEAPGLAFAVAETVALTPTIFTMIRSLFAVSLIAFLTSSNPAPLERSTRLSVVSGVGETGHATEQWLAMLRKRLPRDRYDAIAPLRKALTADETKWAELVRARVSEWEKMVPELAELVAPTRAPARAAIVLGNRGAEDAFTHDSVTIGFDLEALRRNYGNAGQPDNVQRIDRLFRHEFVHLLQKAWLRDHPWEMNTPVGAALFDIWAEGLGNYYSLSSRWLSKDGRRSEAAAAALKELEPRFVERMAALACATPAAATPLLADLSSGRFDQKWGALPAALWLEAEQSTDEDALRRFFLGGPDGVWDIAERHLPEELRPRLREARESVKTCVAR